LVVAYYKQWWPTAGGSGGGENEIKAAIRTAQEEEEFLKFLSNLSVMQSPCSSSFCLSLLPCLYAVYHCPFVLFSSGWPQPQVCGDGPAKDQNHDIGSSNEQLLPLD